MSDDSDILETPITQDWIYRQAALDFALRSCVGQSEATAIVARAEAFLRFLKGDNG